MIPNPAHPMALGIWPTGSESGGGFLVCGQTDWLSGPVVIQTQCMYLQQAGLSATTECEPFEEDR